MKDVHAAAQQGYAVDAGRYARGRPEYPAALEGWLRERLGLQAGATVVDVGAGTGKFTKLVAATEAQTLAVEPVDAMREQLARSLAAVQALAGSAEALPLEDGSVDAVVCAQAFHWFATEAALAEMHRVLRPGGRLGLVWNVRDESVDWVARITEIITPLEGDVPRFYKGDWRRPFDAGSFFELPAPEVFAYQHVGTPQAVVVDRIMSVSFIAALAPAGKARVQAALQELVDSHPALRGRQEVAFPYRTEAYCCTRRP
ncbi:class I SAM-dependent methyltransferase [Pelomonas sp. KK5]|uniref:class I SAM-dependent methyltransferase n=1 Tax=Pelomonas sp. KK5 TaxID=1855730 RepID=UPI00097C253D|nr:class I SAM-dependent methyltransferase [Pelomonas sp. KK5]